MPKPSTKKSSVQSTSEAPSVASAPSVAEKAPKKSDKPKRAKKAPATQSVVESVPASATVPESTSETKSRVAPTAESVAEEFDQLINFVSLEADLSKVNKTNGKVLRNINKRLKALKKRVSRISKQKVRQTRTNTNSGFLTPVNISGDLAKFTGWDKGVPRSRVEVTKFMCDYIKKNNLQNDKDKRQINVDTDSSLKKLLNFDSSKDEPLNYCRMQKYLKHHFTPVPKVAPAPVAPVTSSSASSSKTKKN